MIMKLMKWFKEELKKTVKFIKENKLLVVRLSLMAFIAFHNNATSAAPILGINTNGTFGSSGTAMPWDGPMTTIGASLLGPVPRLLCLLSIVGGIATWMLAESQFTQKSVKYIFGFSGITGIVSIYGWFNDSASGCTF